MTEIKKVEGYTINIEETEYIFTSFQPLAVVVGLIMAIGITIASMSIQQITVEVGFLLIIFEGIGACLLINFLLKSVPAYRIYGGSGSPKFVRKTSIEGDKVAVSKAVSDIEREIREDVCKQKIVDKDLSKVIELCRT